MWSACADARSEGRGAASPCGYEWFAPTEFSYIVMQAVVAT